MFADKGVSALNHVLKGEGWARERLRAFAGQHVRLVGGPLKLNLAVDGEGYFRLAQDADTVSQAVTIELPADTPFRFLIDRKSVLAAARISGTADFAEALAFVFRNLRWDVEEDLSTLLGDVAAHRLVRTGKALFQWQQQAGSNLAANLAEYLGEESGLLVVRGDMERFSADLAELRRELDRLEQRLARPD